MLMRRMILDEKQHTNSQVGCLNRVCETRSEKGEKFAKRWWEERI
jgi:hypothetical protein